MNVHRLHRLRAAHFAHLAHFRVSPRSPQITRIHHQRNQHRHSWRNLRTIVKAGAKGPLITLISTDYALPDVSSCAHFPQVHEVRRLRLARQEKSAVKKIDREVE
jgi:hypothetical protein